MDTFSDQVDYLVTLSPFTAIGNMTVGYNPVLYTATEDQGFVVLNITVIDPPFGGTPRPFTLVVNTHDGTASIFVPLVIKCVSILRFYRVRCF